MKNLVLIVLLFSGPAYSQTLKDKLQGTWVCTRIVDDKNLPIPGIYGESDDYLKFTFSKNEIYISKAPFEKGLSRGVSYFGDYFLVLTFMGVRFKSAEEKFTVLPGDGSEVIMTTQNEKGKVLYHHFINQHDLPPRLKEGEVVDNGLIVIKQLFMSNGRTGVQSVYKVTNEPDHLYPTPEFHDALLPVFGNFILKYFAFPKTFPLETVSEELIVDLDVGPQGGENIKIVRGIDYEINSAFFYALEKTKRKWKLNTIGKYKSTTMRFHFVFFLGSYELQIKDPE
jgi:hypothetical protein